MCLYRYNRVACACPRKTQCVMHHMGWFVFNDGRCRHPHTWEADKHTGVACDSLRLQYGPDVEASLACPNTSKPDDEVPYRWVQSKVWCEPCHEHCKPNCTPQERDEFWNDKKAEKEDKKKKQEEYLKEKERKKEENRKVDAVNKAKAEEKKRLKAEKKAAEGK